MRSSTNEPQLFHNVPSGPRRVQELLYQTSCACQSHLYTYRPRPIACLRGPNWKSSGTEQLHPGIRRCLEIIRVITKAHADGATHVLPAVFWISRWTWLKVAHDSSTSGKMPVPDTCTAWYT